MIQQPLVFSHQEAGQEEGLRGRHSGSHACVAGTFRDQATLKAVTGLCDSPFSLLTHASSLPSHAVLKALIFHGLTTDKAFLLLPLITLPGLEGRGPGVCLLWCVAIVGLRAAAEDARLL